MSGSRLAEAPIRPSRSRRVLEERMDGAAWPGCPMAKSFIDQLRVVVLISGLWKPVARETNNSWLRGNKTSTPQSHLMESTSPGRRAGQVLAIYGEWIWMEVIPCN